MTIQTTTAPSPTTPQLIDALKTLESSEARDLGIHLLESGKLTSDSNIADLGNAIKAHYQPAK